ncbi:MAG TPA: polysaccharide lyase family 7 protein [Pseudonocardia sp.]|nr:polysaccharide lyase family 7 protein [Pseudonocardia sp.]
MSGGRHRRSDDDAARNAYLTGTTPAGAGRNGTARPARPATGQNGAARNGSAGAVTGQNGVRRAATGQTSALRTPTGQAGALRTPTEQTGALRTATGRTGAGRTAVARPAAAQTTAAQTTAARPAAVQTGTTQTATAEPPAAQPTHSEPIRAYPTAAALNAAARAARARAAHSGTTETQAPRTSIPTPRHPATGELLAPDEDLYFDEQLTTPFGFAPVLLPPAEDPVDLAPTEVGPRTDRPAAPAPAEEAEPEPAPGPEPARPSHSLRGSIAALSWPRRLLIALVVLALLGGALWMAAVRPTAQVPPAPLPLPLPATPLPVTPPSAGPSTPPSTPPSTAPKPPPTGPVSLTGWKLTIPEASDKGTAANVNPAASKSPWLTRGDDGSIKFWAPVDGATTPNSEHPRTELDSLTNFKAGASPHAMNATLVVSQAPSANQDIIIGQIHGADDISSVPFVMLHYDAGTIKVVVKEAQSGSTSDKYPLITGVPLGARFSYTISDLGNGNLVFSASYGTNTRSVTTQIPQPFRGATVRFQAGAYQQGDSSSGATDGARLTFYTLKTTPGS